MPKTRILWPSRDTGGDLARSFDALRAEYELSLDYPEAAVAEAREAMAAVQMPERDETAVPFFTIDPVGSMDLDQAMHLEEAGDGFRVRYAIADVPLYVRPGGNLDAETRRRGQTIYMPDVRIPLHPSQLSEGAASLLPDQVCSAFVWDMTLDARGEVTDATLYRAQVRSVERLDYRGVQGAVDSGSDDPRLALLKRIGEHLGRNAVQLGVQLKCGDEVCGAGNLEVHVAECIFCTEDIGKCNVLGLTVDFAGYKTHGDTCNRCLQWNTSVVQGQGGSTDRAHGGGAVGAQSLRDLTDCVWEFLTGWDHWQNCAFCKCTVADFAALWRAHTTGFAGGVWREVVVVHVALRIAWCQGVDLLFHLEHVQGGDTEDLGLATLEE